MSDSFNSYLANLGDVTVEQVPQGDHPPDVVLDGQQTELQTMMDGRETINNQQEENIIQADHDRRKEISLDRNNDMEEIRAEGSADDMELDDTIDSRIGMRMENEGQHISLDGVEAEDDDSIDAANLLDSLPLEGM